MFLIARSTKLCFKNMDELLVRSFAGRPHLTWWFSFVLLLVFYSSAQEGNKHLLFDYKQAFRSLIPKRKSTNSRFFPYHGTFILPHIYEQTQVHFLLGLFSDVEFFHYSFS